VAQPSHFISSPCDDTDDGTAASTATAVLPELGTGKFHDARRLAASFGPMQGAGDDTRAKQLACARRACCAVPRGFPCAWCLASAHDGGGGRAGELGNAAWRIFPLPCTYADHALSTS